MSVSKESTVALLLKEIGDFQRDTFSVVQKRIGFCFLVLGWLVTSQEARTYLKDHPGIAIAGGIVVILSTMNLAVMVGRARRRSMEIAEALKNLGINSVLYRHRILDQRQAVSLTAFNIMVGVIILYMLLNILRGA
jgi:hypothetical protein